MTWRTPKPRKQHSLQVDAHSTTVHRLDTMENHARPEGSYDDRIIRASDGAMPCAMSQT